MKIVSFFIRQKLSAELKKVSKKTDNKIRNICGYFSEKYDPRNVINTLKKEHGGGLGTIFVGLAAILLVFVIFINIADYSLFTYKRNAISKAMDYAVTAAVQQINKNQSVVGLANGFTEDTGERMLDGVEIDTEMAVTTFLTVFYANYKSNNLNIDNSLLVCATSKCDERLKYNIKANSKLISSGDLENSVLIEERINEAVARCWPNTEDKSQVYINQNPKTNMIDNGTYLLAFIKDLKITGIYSQRNVSLSSFAGAKLERRLR